jgi:hypothetical protein
VLYDRDNNSVMTVTKCGATQAVPVRLPCCEARMVLVWTSIMIRTTVLQRVLAFRLGRSRNIAIPRLPCKIGRVDESFAMEVVME